VKITKRQLGRIIREEVARLLEYEQYVDEEGNIHDDEGNVTPRGRDFGSRYGGGTYGLHAPWDRSSSRRPYRSTPDRTQVAAIKATLDTKENKFLRSILQQLEAGRTLSAKQKNIVRSIIKKTAIGAGMDYAEALALFESRRRRRS